MVEFPDRLREDGTQVVLSTDSLGALGDPQNHAQLGEVLFPRIKFKGEGLGWRYKLDRLVQGSAPMLAGIHGRMGEIEVWRRLLQEPSDVAKTTILNYLLLTPTTTLIDRANAIMRARHQLAAAESLAPAVLYFLTHEPASRWLLKNPVQLVPGVTLAVENHIGEHCAMQAVATTEALRSQGYDAVNVFDIVHSLRSMKKPFYKDIWPVMLRQLEDAGQCLVHLPIGTNPDDSLDFSQITDTMLKELATVLHKQKSFVIIEHQVAGLRASVHFKPAADVQLVSRAQQIIELLRKHGVLCLTEN